MRSLRTAVFIAPSPRETWPAWRSLCREALMAYRLASLALDLDGMVYHLVRLLQLPARALPRTRGGRNRITRDINSRVSRILREREDFTEGVMKRDNRTGSDPDAARVIRCTALVRSGYISRAARTLGQSDLPAVDEKIIDVLRELHPSAQGDPPSIPSTAPILAIDSAALTTLVARKLKNGSSGGPSGWTGELVFALMDDPDCVQGICALVADMLNGQLPDQARTYLTCSILIPVSKPGGGVRPIAVSEVFYRLASLYALDLVRDVLPNIFEPIQLGVGSVGGSERAIHLLQAGLATMGPETVILKCDFKNAFNERKREQILSTLFDENSLRPLWRLSHWSYKAPSELLVLDNGGISASIRSEQGVKQGDGLGSLLFSLSVQSLYRRATRNVRNVRCVAVADDLNLIGPVGEVLRVFDDLSSDIRDTGLRLRASKCGLLWPHRTHLPAEFSKAAENRSIPIFHESMVTLGAPVGFDQDGMNTWLRGQVESHSRFFKLLLRPDFPVQVAFLLLRLCMVPSMGYLARVVPPRVLATHATTFDDMVTCTASEKLGLSPSIDNAAFIPLSLPIRLGGFGLRSVRLVSPAAYWASLACSAPYILDFVPDRQQFIRGELKGDFVENVKVCHQALRDMIQNVPKELVPTDPDKFWSNYGQGRVSRGLQKALSHLVDERVAAHYVVARNSRQDKQRMTSCSARNAGAWIMAVPQAPVVTLSDSDYCYAARHRLGLHPQHDLPPKCVCGESLRDDPAHFHSCPRLMPRAITARHDALVQVVASMFKRAGGMVTIEVKCEGETRIRPDIEIILPDRSLLVDVAVVHPAAPSRRSQAVLAAARDIENAKSAKYRAAASERGASFLAFIAESYGALGNQAGEVLKLLNNTLNQAPARPFELSERAVAETLSVALQRGNAFISHTGSLTVRAQAARVN